MNSDSVSSTFEEEALRTYSPGACALAESGQVDAPLSPSKAKEVREATRRFVPLFCREEEIDGGISSSSVSTRGISSARVRRISGGGRQVDGGGGQFYREHWRPVCPPPRGEGQANCQNWRQVYCV